jgi:hypothetical protein
MEPLTFRFIERILVVLIGGASIYFGYRLFSSVPGQSDGKGTFKFPMHTSVILTKVGPGVFFALFGTVAICIALLQPQVTTLPDGSKVSYAGEVMAASNARADGRALLRREIAVLNSTPGMLDRHIDEQDRDDVIRSLRRVKLLLMKPVWGGAGEGFGSFEEFESWVSGGETGPPPAGSNEAMALYRYGARP